MPVTLEKKKKKRKREKGKSTVYTVIPAKTLQSLAIRNNFQLRLQDMSSLSSINRVMNALIFSGTEFWHGEWYISKWC